MIEPSPTKGRAAEARPTVKLKAKKGGRFFAGAPWVYAGEIAFDRRTKALAPGTIATLIDSERTPVATVAMAPGSTIAARALSRDPGAEIDQAFLEARLRAAADLRARAGLGVHHRLVHAEGDGLPGLVIDRFGDVLAVQPNAAWTEALRAPLRAALETVFAPETIVWRSASRGRALEGLEPVSERLGAPLDGPVATPMNGATYFADLEGGQKTGFFFDQRDTHAAVARLAGGAAVLDVFSHVGGFALAALAGGAASALAVDGSEAALELARRGAAASGAEDRFETLRADAFDAMRGLEDQGRRFDVVVCDPPAFAPTRDAFEAGLRGYAKVARLGAALVAPGGVLALCSCSHPVSAEAFEATCASALHKAGRRARLLRSGGAGPDHPVHPHLPETRYLKTAIYALDGAAA